MAVHSLVFWAVVSHSQKRKKCLSTGCRSSALWAEWRCRYRVTLTMVMCVITRVTAISCHAERSRRPLNHINILKNQSTSTRRYCGGFRWYSKGKLPRHFSVHLYATTTGFGAIFVTDYTWRPRNLLSAEAPCLSYRKLKPPARALHPIVKARL